MKHNFLFLTALFLLFWAPVSLRAQKSRPLTLSQSVQLALQNSKQLKLSGARVDEAVANTRQMWNNHLPDLKVSGAYMRINNPDVNLKVKLGGSDSSKSSGSVKVNQLSYAMATATLPLFSGFRIKYGVESAKYLEQAARLDAVNDREEVVENAISAYINLYKARRSVDMVAENLAQQKQRVTDFTNLEQNGIIARNDLLKAQLQQSNIELTLLDAENSYKIACVNMDLMLGFPEDIILVPDSAGIVAPTTAGSILNWEVKAFDNRKDIQAYTVRGQAANSAIKSTRGEYYPGIALTGGYAALDIPNFLSVYNALNIGVGLQYNLGALWKTGAKIDQAKARLHQLEVSQDQLSDQVRIQVNQAFENCLLSLRKIEVYEKAIEQANENYRITKNKYNNNLATTTDLLEADVAQLQARLNYAFSKADALVAYTRLQQASGVLADNYK